MISVDEARQRILATLVPVGIEQVALSDALGRVTAAPVCARRTQPPTDMSAMDGYAVRAEDVAAAPSILNIISEVAAGTAYEKEVPPGACVRIFTGAPLPPGTDTIVIQEDTEANDSDDMVTINTTAAHGAYVRPAGLDFAEGHELIPAGKRLGARDIGLIAAMNVPWLSVRRQPRVAILSTGDEIVLPGDPVGPNQIVSSNGPALTAAVAVAGGTATLLPVARDDAEMLKAVARNAMGYDFLLTTGGASVGKHDLVSSALREAGLALDFWKIAMRPGKPLMFGDLNDMPMLGLPGNPVSAMVCFLLFGQPALAALSGLTDTAPLLESGTLTVALPENDHREDYLRATLKIDSSGSAQVTPFSRQDSSMMQRLATADCLVRRPPRARPAEIGEDIDFIRFFRGYLQF